MYNTHKQINLQDHAISISRFEEKPGYRTIYDNLVCQSQDTRIALASYYSEHQVPEEADRATRREIEHLMRAIGGENQSVVRLKDILASITTYQGQ